jgi:hypothetical protein
MLATRARRCPAAERAATAMAVTTADNTIDVTVSLPTVEFNLADYASHDEQGLPTVRTTSRRWERRR